jgi:Tfp pilus assembly protein PilF
MLEPAKRRKLCLAPSTSKDRLQLAMSAPAQNREMAERKYHEALDLVASGDPAAAARFREALALDPNLLDAMHGLVRALQDAGEHDQAFVAALELIARDPDDPLAHTSLSILYQYKGMVPEAEAEALKAKLLGWKRELHESKSGLDPSQ